MRYWRVLMVGSLLALLCLGLCPGMACSENSVSSDDPEYMVNQAREAVQRGRQLSQEGQLEQALVEYQQALSQFQTAGHSQGQADAMSDMAVVCRKLGEVERSLTLQQQAAELYQTSGDIQGQAKALRRIGVLFRHQGDFAQAIASQEASLELLTQIRDQNGIAMVLTNLGTIYGDLGRLQDARSYFEQALDIYTTLDHQQGVSYTYGNLGQVLLYLGDSQQALPYLEQSLALKQTLSDTRGQANTLLNIGIAYRNLGNFQQAFTSYYQAFDMYQHLNDRYGEAVTIGNIGSTYEELGDADRALQFLLQAVELKKQWGTSTQVTVALTDLAALAIKQRRFAEAESYLREGLVIATGHGSLLAQAHVYGQYGAFYLQQEHLEQALREFTRSLELYEEAGSQKGLLEAFEYLGQTYLRQGNVQEAQTYYDQALQLAGELNDSNFLWKVQYRLGQIALHQGQDEQALAYFRASVDTLEHIRSYLNVPELRQLFVRKDLNPYTQIIRLLLDKQKIQEALLYLERFKARTFLEVVTHGEPQLHPIPALLQDEQYVSAKIRYLQERLTAVMENSDRKPQPSDTSNEDSSKASQYIAQELLQSKEQYEQLLLQIKLQYPEYYRLKTVDADEIRQLLEKALASLDPNVVMLEYFLDEEALHIWVIESSQIQYVSVPVSRQEVLEKVLTLRTELRQYFSTRVYPVLHDLYTWLIVPVEPYLAEKTTIGVVPFQILHFVPFSALLKSPWNPESQGDTAIPDYLINTYAMFSLPSFSMLPAVQERMLHPVEPGAEAPRSYFFGIGNATENLPGAEQEILSITRQFADSQGYTGSEATKQRVFEEAGDYTIVHLATHGVYDKQHPMFSYLEFPSESLYAREIFGLELHADLVTLSGCETLLPQQIEAEDVYSLVSGDELVGFIRAFMYAGTPSVLSSLWRVNDTATHYLMSAFYQHLPRVGKVEALQQACQSVMRSTLQVGRRRKREIRLIHPFFWSSFVLIGDWK